MLVTGLGKAKIINISTDKSTEDGSEINLHWIPYSVVKTGKRCGFFQEEANTDATKA